MILAMVAQPSFGQRAKVMRWSLKNSSGAGGAPWYFTGSPATSVMPSA